MAYSDDPAESGRFVHFLVDRVHVLEHRIAIDRGKRLAAVALAIGPYFFRANQFWDYPNACRFTLQTTQAGLAHHLGLMDEFLSASAEDQRAQPI